MYYSWWIVLALMCYSSWSLAALPLVSAGTIERIESMPSKWVPTRPVDIWLPEGFNTQQRYAVLYMHDGQMLFDASTTWNQQEWRVDETVTKLMNAGKIPPIIVVAIHNLPLLRHAEYYPQQPFSQLTPEQQQQLYQLERNPGQLLFQRPVYSDRYLKFIVQERKPYIDTHYPVKTDAKHTFIMGSSMGGLISWYAMMQYPDVFGGAGCLSTHWPGTFLLKNNPSPATFQRYIAKHLPVLNQHKLYFDFGDQTLDALYPPLQRQVDQLLQVYPAQFWQSRFFKGAAHSEQDWANRLSVPLVFLLSETVMNPATLSGQTTFDQ